jgi:hypothetical protein
MENVEKTLDQLFFISFGRVNLCVTYVILAHAVQYVPDVYHIRTELIFQRKVLYSIVNHIFFSFLHRSPKKFFIHQLHKVRL